MNSTNPIRTYTFKVVVGPDEDARGNPAWHAYCPALEGIGAATSGRTRQEALSKINEVVHMIVQEFIEEGKPLPEGPEGSVEIEEISLEEPRIAVTVRRWPSTIMASAPSRPESSPPPSLVTAFISSAKGDLISASATRTVDV